MSLAEALPGLPTAAPHEVGLSAERLARIRPAMEARVAEGWIPGALTLVARRGRIVHLETVGQRDLERERPVEPDTIFRIASMTKPVTSVALMILFERGHFQLDAPIARWLPRFGKMEVASIGEDGEERRVPAKRPISVRHLLTHTSGIANPAHPATAKAAARAARLSGRSDTIADFADRIADAPLCSQPGEVWAYSRATCIAGRLVEVISGKSLAAFMEEELFGPLAMVDTHFFLPEEKIPRLAAAYTPKPAPAFGADGRVERSGGLALAEPASEKSFWIQGPPGYFMGSGGLVSTAADYFRFADMLLQGGRREGERILSRKTVELMTCSHTGDRFVDLAGPGQGFGLGFGVTLDRGRARSMPSEGSYTWGGAFCTHWWNDPVEALHGMVLTQVRPYDHLPLRQDFQSLATAAIDD